MTIGEEARPSTRLQLRYNINAMSIVAIQLPLDAIAALCKAHAVRRLALFGSVLRNDFGPQSDVDVLVEFAPGQAPGLFGFAALERELSELLGREAHLHTPAMLGPAFRDQVLQTAAVQYAA